MTEVPVAFSFPSYRGLCRYLGETDAMVEVTELAARAFLADAKQSGNVASFVKAASAKHKISVNLAEVDCLTQHLNRNYIVTVYQSAERFFHKFREEHQSLYHKVWSGDGEGVDPLTLALKNIAGSQRDAEGKVGPDLISRFQYYRIVRNWVVHPKDPNIAKPQAKYAEITPYTRDHQELFRALSAPHLPEALDFDDFILLSRLTKVIAEALSQIAMPPHDHWLGNFPMKDFKGLEKNSERMRNAIAGRLRTEYGMDGPSAIWIAQELCDSLAQR